MLRGIAFSTCNHILLSVAARRARSSRPLVAPARRARSSRPQADEGQDETRRRSMRNRKSLSTARKEQGHAAVRVHHGNDVQFEEASTPLGANTYMREVSPGDAHELDAHELDLLRRRRGKRIKDARIAAEKAASAEQDREVERKLDDVERREQAEEEIEEAQVRAESESEKARVIVRGQHAVESRFELLGYSNDSALMQMWSREKQHADHGITIGRIIQSMAKEKSERAKRRYTIDETLRDLRESLVESRWHKSQLRQLHFKEYEEWKAEYLKTGPLACEAHMIISRLKSNSYADLGLIAGYFLSEVRLVSGASSSRYHSLYSALVPLRDGPLHFTTDARGSEGHARDQGVRFLLSDEITADEFARRLQAFDVDESPV